MGILQHKTILLISPQSWGKMFLSKHHYALELAKQGNKVFFLEPPGDSQEKISIEPSGMHPGLMIIRHRLSFPYNLKFRSLPVFHALMRGHVKKIIGKIALPLDIVWSFDLGYLYPFRFFPASALRIFHPVDEPLTRVAIQSARGAQVIFSVTREILEKYADYDVPRHFINHGVSQEFLSPMPPGATNGDAIHVGFSGNLLRNDIDRPVLLRVLQENPGIQFDFFGSYKANHTNIGGEEDAAAANFIKALQELPNVKLHGVLNAAQLPEAYRSMDGFLICYDVERDQSKGTNYHKVMEFISTGKVIVSNNITTYQNQPELVQMVADRDHNRELPVLFSTIMSHLGEYNDPGIQNRRRTFAEENSYAAQLNRITAILLSFH